MRRRPSTDYLSLSTVGLTERPKLNHSTTGPGSPLRERLGGYMGRRRGDSSSAGEYLHNAVISLVVLVSDGYADQPPLTLPRKLSQSSLQAPLLSPREALPSPRTRIPGTAGIDGVLSDSWSVRRRPSEGGLKVGGRTGEPGENQDNPQASGIKEEEEEQQYASADGDGGRTNGAGQPSQQEAPPESPQVGRGDVNTDNVSAGVGKLSLNTQGNNVTADNANNTAPHTPVENVTTGPPPGIVDLSTVEWSYLDPQGQVQGGLLPNVSFP